MGSELGSVFLDFSVRKLRQHTSEIERCLARLSEEQVWYRRTENENAMGSLVLHLCGNVGQRVTAFTGRPDVRVRELEFSTKGGIAKTALMERLRVTVDEMVAILSTMPAEKIGQLVTVGEFHNTILESTYHMVGHFALHTGQIIFATKLMTGENLGFYQPPAPK